MVESDIGTPAEHRAEILEALTDWEHRIENADEMDDPLDVHVGYTQWLEQRRHELPQGERRWVMALEHATRLFRDETRYHQDARYLQLWIRYAGCVEDAREIFAYLAHRGIGQELALFYEEFSLYYESVGRY